MKPPKGKKPFMLCRKHIGLDLTETSGFTHLKKHCVYCNREWANNSYHKLHAVKKSPIAAIKDQIEMTKEREVPEKPTKLTKVNTATIDEEERKLIRMEKNRQFQRNYSANLTDGYIRKQISQHSDSLVSADISQELVDVYRELMLFKRAIKAKSNGDLK